MSELLDALLEERRRGALEYQDYLSRLLEQATKLGKGETETPYPKWADNGARRALVDFFGGNTATAMAVDKSVRDNKPDSWVGNRLKERRVKRAVRQVLPENHRLSWIKRQQERLRKPDAVSELALARHRAST